MPPYPYSPNFDLSDVKIIWFEDFFILKFSIYQFSYNVKYSFLIGLKPQIMLGILYIHYTESIAVRVSMKSMLNNLNIFIRIIHLMKRFFTIIVKKYHDVHFLCSIVVCRKDIH
jgi:hypothetical protein